MEKENRKENKVLHLTRRMFLQFGLWVTGLASGWVVLKFLSYDPPRQTLMPSVTLGESGTYRIGTNTYIPELNAWLIRDTLGLFAVSGTCTHLGCSINAEPKKFVCPCHDSQFSLNGTVLQGPAGKPLPHYQVSLSDTGAVIVDRRVAVPSFTRLP